MPDELATDLCCDPNNQPDDYLADESIHEHATGLLDADPEYALWRVWVESRELPF